MTDCLVDTNILIYHTQGSPRTIDFIAELISRRSFTISILTEIEFLGWDKHTPEGFEKCKKLINAAHIYPLDDAVASRAIELKRKVRIKLADAVIAATAVEHGLRLATRNIDDFRAVEGIEVFDPLGEGNHKST